MVLLAEPCLGAMGLLLGTALEVELPAAQCACRTRTKKETKSSSPAVRQNIVGFETQLVNCLEKKKSKL